MYDKIYHVLGTRDVGTLKHVVEAGTPTDCPIPIPTSPRTIDSIVHGSNSSLKRSIKLIKKQSEKLREIMQGLQENQSKQLEMVASFIGSQVEAIKDKK